MKNRMTLLLVTMTMVLCSARAVYAENQVPAVSVATTPATNVTSTPSGKTADITKDPLYTTLLSKNDTKNKLILQENQICKQIKEQEDVNNKKASAIKEKAQSYGTAYNKVVDEIKLLLDPIKNKEAFYFKDSSINKTDITNEVNQEADIYDSQINNLNLAVKYLRESMKYINLESVKYNRKVEAVQKNIDNINLSIAQLTNEITADKLNKDKEWNNFSAAMVKGDLKAANESFDNMLKLKEHIINNYTEILKNKKSIEEQLASVEAA